MTTDIVKKTGLFGRNNLKLMRIPFSYFLMPVFFFALSQCYNINVLHTIIAFVVLHLFIYPASNGYNSYMDQDETSIGGLKHPPKATIQLFYLSLLFDGVGLLLALLVNVRFCACVLMYILVSRGYSYKGIRLKKYPIIGFITIAFFQGGFTFWMVYNCVNLMPMEANRVSVCLLLASSLLVGGFYPLTQIYQHEADRQSGDITISLMLGYRGTFLFTACVFACASVLLYLYFTAIAALQYFLLLQLFLLPAVLYFGWWFIRVLRDNNEASFEHAMIMNKLGATMLNACFITLLILQLMK